MLYTTPRNTTTCTHKVSGLPCTSSSSMSVESSDLLAAWWRNNSSCVRSSKADGKPSTAPQLSFSRRCATAACKITVSSDKGLHKWERALQVGLGDQGCLAGKRQDLLCSWKVALQVNGFACVQDLLKEPRWPQRLLGFADSNFVTLCCSLMEVLRSRHVLELQA